MLLIAAKQFGIHTLSHSTSNYEVFLRIQSLVEFCRNNTHLKALNLHGIFLLDEESTISVLPQDAGPQDSSAITALDELKLCVGTLENSSVASKFRTFLAHVTYRTLELSSIHMDFYDVDDDVEEVQPGVADSESGDEKEEKKIARLHIVSELLKPSVEVFCLHSHCRSEAMDAIEACATVTQIQMSSTVTRGYFSPDDVQQKLQAVAMRNLELARFVANPPGYPHQELLKLLSQFESIPAGVRFSWNSFVFQDQ